MNAEAMDVLRRFMALMDAEVGKNMRAQQAFTDYHYSSAYGFVMQEGESFEPAPCPPELAMSPGFCFGQAIIVAICTGLPYVEGYAYPGRGLPAVHHAWNVWEDGRVLDVTWALAEVNGAPVENRAYMGVRFSAKRADEATWDRDASILDDFAGGYPILRRPWADEASPGDTTGLLDAIAQRDGYTGAELEAAFARRSMAVGRRR